MEILGIGPTEFLFIIVILLLVLGPADLVQLGQKTGRLIRKLRDSETWLIVSNLARTMRNLPNALADEAGTDEILREVMPERYRNPVGNLPLENKREKIPDEASIRPPEADAFAAWTTPNTSEAESSPNISSASEAETETERPAEDAE